MTSGITTSDGCESTKRIVSAGRCSGHSAWSGTSGKRSRMNGVRIPPHTTAVTFTP